MYLHEVLRQLLKLRFAGS